MTVDTIEGTEGFLALRQAWNELAAGSGARTPYLRHEWAEAWWAGFGGRSRLRIVTVRERANVVALAPMMVSRRTLAGLPVTAHHFLGLNLGHLDFLVAEHTAGRLAMLMDTILASGEGDIVIARGPLAGGPTDVLVRGYLQERGIRFLTRSYGEVYLDGAHGIDRYLAERPSKLWGNVRNRRRRLEAAGRVETSRHRFAGGRDAALRAIFDVSLRSWKGRAGTAIGLQEPFRRFFERLFELFGAAGEVEAWLLSLDARPIAYRFGLRNGDAFVECDIAYDEAFASYSPGTLLGAASNEALVREGVREISLGPEFPWKGEWSPSRRERLEYLIFRPARLYARVLERAYRLREAYRAAAAQGQRGVR